MSIERLHATSQVNQLAAPEYTRRRLLPATRFTYKLFKVLEATNRLIQQAKQKSRIENWRISNLWKISWYSPNWLLTKLKVETLEANFIKRL